MRAAVLTQINEAMPVEELTPVDPGPRDVLVNVTASGVCHSDLSVYHGYIGDMTPIVLGHEGTGIVEKVGSEVTSVKPGDRIIATFIPACGHCWWCLRDQTNLCEHALEVSAVPRFKRSEDIHAGAGLLRSPDEPAVTGPADPSLVDRLGRAGWRGQRLDAPYVYTAGPGGCRCR